VRERGVRLARQEIQGVIQLIRGKPAAAVREIDYRDLDIASTGTQETVREEDMEGEYCVERHRNGDYILRMTPDSTH
jgi:hypothetical protein